MKYEKIAECPPRLGRWLELVNSVPDKVVNDSLGRIGKRLPKNKAVEPWNDYLKSWEERVNTSYFDLTGEDLRDLLESPGNDYRRWKQHTNEQMVKISEAFDAARDRLKETAQEFPALYSYLFEPGGDFAAENNSAKNHMNSEEYEKRAYMRYKIFLEMRAEIRQLAEANMLDTKTLILANNEEFPEMIDFDPNIKSYKVYGVEKNGKLDFDSVVTRNLRGTTLSRLRICPICMNIFWARRIPSDACSNKKCSNNFHQRQKRIREYEERLEKRRSRQVMDLEYYSSQNSLLSDHEKEIKKLEAKIKAELLKNFPFRNVFHINEITTQNLEGLF